MYYNSAGLEPGSYVPLGKGERPRLVETMDLPAAIERYKAAGYIVLGDARASLVLYGALPEGMIEKRYAVPVTDTEYDLSQRGVTSTGQG